MNSLLFKTMKKYSAMLYFIVSLIISTPAQDLSQSINLLQQKGDGALCLFLYDSSYFTDQGKDWQMDNIRVHLIASLNDHRAKRKIKALGAFINTDLGSLITIDAPISAVRKIIALEEVTSLEYGSRLNNRNEKAKMHIGADKVHNGTDLLSNGYDGKGVVIGIIDDGIDVMHADFREMMDSGQSRIAYLWNQAISGRKPSRFSYGREYVRSEINEAIAVNDPSKIGGENHNEIAGVGHGTSVAGSAAGLRGIAPGATIVAVALEHYRGPNFIDAAEFIIQKAELMGMPCIINYSIGSEVYAGDGYGAFTVSFDQLIRRHDRVGICAAAGNSGNPGIYWLANLQNDTVYNGKMSAGSSYAILYLDNENMDSLWLSIYVDSVSLAEDIRTLDYRYIKTADTIGPISFQQIWDKGILNYTALHSDSSIAGHLSLAANKFVSQKTGKSYHEFSLSFDDRVDLRNFELERHKMDFLRIELSGNGKVEARFEDFPPTLTDPIAKGFPEKHYLPTQNQYNVDIPAIADNVLAVGAYINRSAIVSTSGDTIYASGVEGDLAVFSSAGPRPDGRIKPEIVAPGEMVQTSMSRRYLNELGVAAKIDGALPLAGEYANPDVVTGGTSLSTPMATGTIALMWQANPNLTFSQIRDIIANTAIRDDFTEANDPTPNAEWGYGKLNTWAAVQEAERLLEVTPVADFEQLDIQVMPNPVQNELLIDLKSSNAIIYSSFLTDLQGKSLDYNSYKDPPERIIIALDRHNSGAYIVTILTNKGKFSKKIIKQ